MRSVLAGVAAGIVVLILIATYAFSQLVDRRGPRTTDPAAASAAAAATSLTPTASPSGASGGPSASATIVRPSTAPSSPPPVGLRVGSTAPALVVGQLGGGEIDTAALRGRALWINFTASWCPTCRDELPFLQRMQARLGERLRVLVIDVREDRDTVASLASELDLTLPVGLDTDGAAQRAWRAFALPVHYWIDENGTIREVVYGGAGPAQLLDGVRSVVPGASLEP